MWLPAGWSDLCVLACCVSCSKNTGKILLLSVYSVAIVHVYCFSVHVVSITCTIIINIFIHVLIPPPTKQTQYGKTTTTATAVTNNTNNTNSTNNTNNTNNTTSTNKTDNTISTNKTNKPNSSRSTDDVPSICDSLKASFGLRSFRWTAVANLFANVNEQATVQLLPFYIIYCVGVDFRDVGSVNALVAGGQLGAGLLSIPVFAYVLSLERAVALGSAVEDGEGGEENGKDMKGKNGQASGGEQKTGFANSASDTCTQGNGGNGMGGENGKGEDTNGHTTTGNGKGENGQASGGEQKTGGARNAGVVHVPKIHPIYIMSVAALVKLCVQLPLTILAAVHHNIIYLAIAGFAGGSSTGGQPQVTQVLLGWVMDDDEMRHDLRREGTIMASNGAIQHCSFVLISGIIAIWGALGFDTSKCPTEQPTAATDAIFYTYTWLNASWLLLYAVALLFYPIKGETLVKVVATVELRRRREGKNGEED